jgi:hypothetical protein
MAEEDGDLDYWLAREYMRVCGEITWNDDGYMAWAERKLEENHIVYFVWLDDAKPHHIAYDVLKDESPTVGQVRRAVIHCESRARAGVLRTMLLAPDPDGLPEN